MKFPSQNNKTISNDRYILQNTSRCIAHFFPLNKNNFIEINNFIEDDAIISCVVAVDKNSATGSFDLQFKPKKNYKKLINPGDWVLIYLDYADNINQSNFSGLRAIGVVTRVAENTTTMSNGSIVTTYSISGGNWGKILENTDIFYDPYLPQSFQELLLKGAAFDIRGGPLDFINGYLNIFLGDAKLEGLQNSLYQLLIPSKLYETLPKKDGFQRAKGGDVCFDDILVRDFYNDANDGFAINRPITRVIGGSLWNVISQAFNREINEIYLNVKNGKPIMTLRKQPLTKSIRTTRMQETINLPSNELSLKNIVNSNLGTSDHALFNYVMLRPTDELGSDWIFAAKGEYINDFPQINRDSIKKFGVRRVEFATEYAYSQSVALNPALLVQWIRELGEYWLNFHRFENGTIEVIGKNDFYIGEYYLIPELNKCFIVESIQWEWKHQSPITVSLGVTHGVNKDGSYIDEDKNISLINGTNYIESDKRKFIEAL